MAVRICTARSVASWKESEMVVGWMPGGEQGGMYIHRGYMRIYKSKKFKYLRMRLLLCFQARERAEGRKFSFKSIESRII